MKTRSKRTATYYGLKVVGTTTKCEHCALAKARQKNVSKVSDLKADKVGERLYVDVSSVNTPTFGGNRFWLLVADEVSDMCWSYFLAKKK
jgi:hypothetical protein